MAMASNTVGGVQRVPNPSCFDAIDTAATSVAALRGRLCGLVDRFVGSYPEPAADSSRGEIKGVPNGMLGEAQEQAHKIGEYVAVMNAALDRLEKNLP